VARRAPSARADLLCRGSTPAGGAWPTQIQLETVGGNMLEDLMHLTASLDPTPMRKLSTCAKRGGRCHLSRPKGIGFRCIPQLVAPIRVGGVRPRDERSRRLDLSRPFFFCFRVYSRTMANALRPPGCGIHIGNKSGQRSQKSFEKLQMLRKLRPFSVLWERPLWWASLYSRALTTICVP
jgi:hypothetical protein